MRNMSIETTIERVIQEVWEIQIEDNDDPHDVFEYIAEDPSRLWRVYNPTLIDSQDIDETTLEVVRFEVHDE